MKSRLLNGETIELSNEIDNVVLWFSKNTGHFCLELNSVVVKSTKKWNDISDKLDFIGDLIEVDSF